jgi:hypothetical protein
MPTKKIGEEVKGTTVMSVKGRNFPEEDQQKQKGVTVLNRSGGGHLNIDRSELAPSLPPK